MCVSLVAWVGSAVGEEMCCGEIIRILLYRFHFQRSLHALISFPDYTFAKGLFGHFFF